jgi:hypothetical protein
MEKNKLCLLESLVAASMLFVGADSIAQRPVITEMRLQPNQNHPVPTSTSYSTVNKSVNGGLEHQLFRGNHHFATIIDKNGTYIIRCHPGMDINGWGTSIYLQPYAGNEGRLAYTSIDSMTSSADGVDVHAAGHVSRGTSSTFGDWNSALRFDYDPTTKIVNISGSYNINLPAALSTIGADLNLGKIASNKLDEVPRTSGTTGDTGDMVYAHWSSSNPVLQQDWIPENQSGNHCPGDKASYLNIDLITTTIYDVDAIALGQTPIQAACKPNTSFRISSTNNEANISLCASYNMSQSKQYWSDNIGITPQVRQSVSTRNFSYNINIISTTLPQDGIGMIGTMSANYSGNAATLLDVFESSSVPIHEPRKLVGTLNHTSNGIYKGTINSISSSNNLQDKGFFILKAR